MQSTGQTSTQALSFTLMQGSAMMYGIHASRSRELDRSASGPGQTIVVVPEFTQCVKHSAPLGACYWVRRRGSRASRSESPKRLNAKTARLMARPGKIAIHGADSANSTA